MSEPQFKIMEVGANSPWEIGDQIKDALGDKAFETDSPYVVLRHSDGRMGFLPISEEEARSIAPRMFDALFYVHVTPQAATQIDELATFILRLDCGFPDGSMGAVECAMAMINRYRSALKRINEMTLPEVPEGMGPEDVAHEAKPYMAAFGACVAIAMLSLDARNDPGAALRHVGTWPKEDPDARPTEEESDAE